MAHPVNPHGRYIKRMKRGKDRWQKKTDPKYHSEHTPGEAWPKNPPYRKSMELLLTYHLHYVSGVNHFNIEFIYKLLISIKFHFCQL